MNCMNIVAFERLPTVRKVRVICVRFFWTSLLMFLVVFVFETALRLQRVCNESATSLS